jgi:hypothetical protein
MGCFRSIFSDTPFPSYSRAGENNEPPGDAKPVYRRKGKKNHRLGKSLVKEKVMYVAPVWSERRFPGIKASKYG